MSLLFFEIENAMLDQPGSYGLALHTTTPELGMALDNADGDRHQRVIALGRSMAGELHLQLAEFLHPRQWTDLKFIAAARGPGGFTGARMGLVVARTLAQQLDIPVFALSTLAAYAVQQWEQGCIPPDRAIALEMRAQRGQLFTAAYARSGETAVPQALISDQVLSPEDWQTQLETGIPGAPHVIRVTVTESLADSVGSLLNLGQQHYNQGDRPTWAEALPFYGQHPVTIKPQASAKTDH